MFEEEHSAWMVATAIRPTPQRSIGWSWLAMPEYPAHARAWRSRWPSTTTPPFTVIKDEPLAKRSHRWRELLEHVKTEGTREVNVQRYKGLGEMNAEQLWETTMNAETRTLLKVDLQDLAEDGADLFHADGRRCGEPAQVYRRERAGRAQSGR